MKHFGALCCIWMGVLLCTAERAPAGALRCPELQREFERLTDEFDGRVGVCALDSTGSACVRAAERFSLQSVMKLVASLAVMDAVDRGGWRLEESILVQRRDLSLYVQPLAELVGERGYRTTVADLVRRAIVDSDSAAVDILIRKLGGAGEVQAFLDRKGIRDVRIDRDERHLQTEIAGLTWSPEYVDAALLRRAIAAVPEQQRSVAYRRYQADPRDTATPQGMAGLLGKLASGHLLSPDSTRFVEDVMTRTVTFPDRLKAGVPGGWTLGHKTGTSGSWNGVTAATNDVGVLKAPDGGWVSLVVFIGDSRAPDEAKAALMAKIAAATTAGYEQ